MSFPPHPAPCLSAGGRGGEYGDSYRRLPVAGRGPHPPGCRAVATWDVREPCAQPDGISQHTCGQCGLQTCSIPCFHHGDQPSRELSTQGSLPARVHHPLQENIQTLMFPAAVLYCTLPKSRMYLFSQTGPAPLHVNT